MKNCINWQGLKDKDGYGKLSYKNKQWRAHRLSFYLEHGFIDEKLIVMHLCNNPSCINPEHLRQGTIKENNKYTVKSGRYKNKFSVRKKCFNGHRYSKKNTYFSKEKRVCKICRRAADKKRWQLRKSAEKFTSYETKH